jgi:hypothetical protein
MAFSKVASLPVSSKAMGLSFLNQLIGRETPMGAGFSACTQVYF